jgi:hypothetical protein
MHRFWRCVWRAILPISCQLEGLPPNWQLVRRSADCFMRVQWLDFGLACRERAEQRRVCMSLPLRALRPYAHCPTVEGAARLCLNSITARTPGYPQSQRMEHSNRRSRAQEQSQPDGAGIQSVTKLDRLITQQSAGLAEASVAGSRTGPGTIRGLAVAGVAGAEACVPGRGGVVGAS